MSLKRILVFIFCTCISSKALSQITESVTVVNVCFGTNVTYTAPSGATNIVWTFGAASPSTSASSGGFAPPSVGNFNAVFNGIVSGSPMSFTVLVKVNAKPVANFTINQPSNACAVKSVTFTDASTGTAPISSWYWIYGDGGANTLNSGAPHSYGYAVVGNWSVTLIVTDINGCDAQATLGTINVIPSPTAVITPPSSVGCNSILSVGFSAASSSGANLSYNWNFGNGQTGTQVTSTQNYTQQTAPYVVTLTVTASGCSHSTTALVVVSPATLSVTIPTTLCLGVAPTVSLQTNQPFTLWTIDNGPSYVIGTPAPGIPTVQIGAISSPGIHTITVNAGSSPCVATPITKTVYVEQVVPSFTGSTPTVSCGSPFVVSYNNTTGPGTTASWSYKDADSILHTGTGNNPTFSLTLGSKNQYALFYRPFIPHLSMTVTSAAGCVAVLTKTVHSLAKPTSWFTVDKTQGCAPLSVTFSNVSWVYPSGPIITYTWHNGATGLAAQQFSGALSLPPSSNSVVPTHQFVYSTPGVYHPSLTIQTANNYNNVVNTCIDVSWSGTITVVNPPQISFNVPPGPFCPDEVVKITNTSVDSNVVQNWHVTSDNGFFSHCLTQKHPGWKFTNVGQHNLTLTGYSYGCPSSVTNGPITVKGPIAKGMFMTHCQKALRSVVDFTLDLQEVSQATVDFGDATTPTVIASNVNGVVRHVITHTFNGSKDYTVVLTAENSVSQCVNSIDTMIVNVRDARAAFVLPLTGCVNVPVALSAASSTDVLAGCAKGYDWYVDNLPPVVRDIPSFSPAFPTAGNHTVKLFVKDINSCVDSAIHTIRISEVKPQFTLPTTSICLSSGTLQVTNTSLHTPDSLTLFNWNFGNFQSHSTSSMTVPVIQYTRGPVPDTVYTIQLTAMNKLGCVAAVTHTVRVKRPAFNFDQSLTNFCVSMAGPTTISFTPKLTYPSYTINYGISPTSTAITSGPTSYPYTQPGIYTVSIRVKDPEGCENTGTMSVNGVRTPTADFIFASPANQGGNNFCAGKPVTFTNVSLPEPHTPTWQFGSQSLGTNTSNIVSGNFSAPVTSVIAIGLTVTTGAPAFCTSEKTQTFTIYNYAANFAMSDSLVCLGSALSFSIVNDHGLGGFLWSYGDASSTSTLIPPNDPKTTTHTYTTFVPNTNGYLNVALVYWSGDMACRELKDTLIKVIKLGTDFNRNLELTSIDTAHCINLIDKFENTTTSNSSQLTYTWAFGDGAGSDSLSPYHMYNQAGTYQVTLTTRDKQNCSVSKSKNMIIYPLPTATILPSPGGYCPDTNFPLAMEGSPGVVSGTWSPVASIIGPATFTTSTATHTVTGLASETGTYGLVVTSEFGCVSEGTDTTIKIVLPPKPMAWDTSVVIGEKIPLPDFVPDHTTFTWTPVFAHLNCLTCEAPVSNTTVDIVYTLVMEDLLKCSSVNNTYSIHILPQSSVDLPTAFTPNGDGVNDVIYAAGWGIKSLIYLRVYNRWGQLLFETDDINVGWDGNFQGVPQNTETYVYQVSVETYISDEPLTKSSTFKLLR